MKSPPHNIQLLGAVVTLAELGRSFRDVKVLMDSALDVAHRYWFVFPALAAGWAFMVADDDRFTVLEAVTNQVLDALPLEPVERLLKS